MTMWLDPEWSEREIEHLFGCPPRVLGHSLVRKAATGYDLPPDLGEIKELGLRKPLTCGVMRLPGKTGPLNIGDEETQ